MPGLAVRRSTHPTSPDPAIFDAKVYLLLQGQKSMLFADGNLAFVPGRFAISSVGIPFKTQVTQASPSCPYLGLEIDVDASMVANLLLTCPDVDASQAPLIDTAVADAELVGVLERLLRLVEVPADIDALAPVYKRELYYRLLQRPIGSTLRQVVPRHARYESVRRATAWIDAHANEPLQVDELAASTGMSVTTFHRHFKAVTGSSPLAYHKLVRLLRARDLLLSSGSNVTSVAFDVGYTSASQFSREYKRLFGVAPLQDRHRFRMHPPQLESLDQVEA